jgi:predicted protein tyrosine phosphatase
LSCSFVTGLLEVAEEEICNVGFSCGHGGFDVLNVCEGKIKYHQCSIADKEDVDVSVPGARSWEFIESAFEDASSCVLVHCASGVSRAVTITTYYLMRKESIPCEAALQRIRYVHPAACPNGSFIAQLTALNSSLARGIDNRAVASLAARASE